MTVWIVNPFDNLPTEGFRPQRYWLMSRAFAEAGHDVTLFTSDFNHTTKKRRSEVDGQRSKAPFKLEFIPTRPYRSNVSLARIRSHREFVRSLRSTFLSRTAPDLIVVSLPLIGTAAVALELKRKSGTKVVVDIMDDWPGTFYRLFPRWLRPLARLALSPLRRAAARAYREADFVTGVADSYADLALAAGAKGYRRFYHGIETCRPREGARSTGKTKAILYLGNLGRTYDLRTAIEAVALAPGLTLEIAGKGDLEESLKAFAAEKGVADRVRFHGYLDEAAIADLAARCRYGLVPMSDDSCVGVPYKFADYARHGLFILSSLRGESAALLARHRCGAVYTAGDPRSLLSAIGSRPCAADPSSSLLAEFDASGIYREYVCFVTPLRDDE